MAEGTSPNQDDMVCSTFINSCEEGRPPVSNNSIRRPKNCVYFQSGTCRFGSRCRFAHVLNNVGPTSPVQYNGRSIGPPVQLPAYTGLPKFNLAKKLGEPKNESNENLNDNQSRGQLSSSNPPNWVNAPVFVPRMPLSYAHAVKSNDPDYEPPTRSLELCPNFIIGDCQHHDMCPYVHGEICEMCGLAILNRHDENQCKEHIEACEREIEQDMELSFAVQRSVDKSCGICLDVVMDKLPSSERRFGILDNCNHVFCLTCIRRWRRQKSTVQDSDLDNGLNPNVTRSCPACRVSSDFIIPSRYWVETEEEKQKLITDYKGALSKKHCKYFNRGTDKCPFGGYCFYLHELPNGTKVDLPKPERRRRQNQNGELDLVDNFTLWEFLEYREVLGLGDNVYTLPYSETESSESSDGLEWNVIS